MGASPIFRLSRLLDICGQGSRHEYAVLSDVPVAGVGPGVGRRCCRVGPWASAVTRRRWMTFWNRSEGVRDASSFRQAVPAAVNAGDGGIRRRHAGSVAAGAHGDRAAPEDAAGAGAGVADALHDRADGAAHPRQRRTGAAYAPDRAGRGHGPGGCAQHDRRISRFGPGLAHGWHDPDMGLSGADVLLRHHTLVGGAPLWCEPVLR